MNSALSMLFTGYYFGWHVLYIGYSKRTVRKYEKVLNIKVTKYFEAAGSFSHRSAGLAEANKHACKLLEIGQQGYSDIQQETITDDPQSAKNLTFFVAEQKMRL